MVGSRGRYAPAFCRVRQLSLRCRVHRQARGALGAPLKGGTEDTHIAVPAGQLGADSAANDIRPRGVDDPGTTDRRSAI